MNKSTASSGAEDTTSAPSVAGALEAFRRGFTPVAIQARTKRPRGAGWQNLRWETEEAVRTSFTQWAEEGATNLGLSLGEASSGLLDVDLDHPAAARLAAYYLPRTAMVSGRAANRMSHRWYLAEEGEELPETRRYRMPDGSVSVELRSTRGQTVIPPSTHPSGEEYVWEGEPFGGDRGPARVSARKLAVQVALLGLGAILLENWPEQGGRHDAYLALAGGLLRYGEGVHPFWEGNLEPLIEGLAEATGDEDGASLRVSESVETTVRRLREGKKVHGFPRLGELIGVDHAEAARRMAREVESLAGFVADAVGPQVTVSDEIGGSDHLDPTDDDSAPQAGAGDVQEDESLPSTLPPERRDPMNERITTWDPVDLGPFLAGEIVTDPPSILERTDGASLFYPGKVNMLFGASESAKSWIMHWAAIQHMTKGERVLLLDMEDDPAETVKRLRWLGASEEDLQDQLIYVRPEDPIASMQTNRWGQREASEGAMEAQSRFSAMLRAKDPTLVIVDGMTAVYSLHGLDTNDSVGTETINRWLKSLTRGGRTGVVVIDHTTKGGGSGSAPIGSQHKTSMVSGASIRADAVTKPVPGRKGLVVLKVHKDRPGEVRRIAGTQGEAVVANVTIDSTDENRVVMDVAAPPAPEAAIVLDGPNLSQDRLDQLAGVRKNAARVLEVLHNHPDVHITTSDVVAVTGLERKLVYDAWRYLKSAKYVLQEGERRHTKFKLTDVGKEVPPHQVAAEETDLESNGEWLDAGEDE